MQGDATVTQGNHRVDALHWHAKGLFQVRIVAHTIGLIHGHEIATLELLYPRIIHAEVMTHRDRARNAASSRAMRMINTDFVPWHVQAQAKTMQGGAELEGEDRDAVLMEWDLARGEMRNRAQRIMDRGAHKSIYNRLLEPFTMIGVVMTATYWDNFFAQRAHPDAEPHFYDLACVMRTALHASKPRVSRYHLPYVSAEEEDLVGIDSSMAISTSRCAGTTYGFYRSGGKIKGPDGVERDRTYKDDLDRTSRLIKGGEGYGHRSPFEHPCREDEIGTGCMCGWATYRSLIWKEELTWTK